MAKAVSRRNKYRLRKAGQDSFQKFIEFSFAIIAGVVGYIISSKSGFDDTIQQSLLKRATSDTPLDIEAIRLTASAIRSIADPLFQGMSFIIALLSSLLALLLTQTGLRFVNSRQEQFISKLYTCPPETLDLLEEIVGHSETFSSNLRNKSEDFTNLFHKLWRGHTDQYLGVIQNLSEFDVDVDSHSEVVFTKNLVSIAERTIDAISVDERSFWGKDREAEAYFLEQEGWLQTNKSRCIRRIFVLEEPKSGETPETPEFPSGSQDIVTRHRELTSRDSFQKVADRYVWKLISWRDWHNVIKLREDLIIYDQEYIRRGLLVSVGHEAEHRRAYFRANKAEVGDLTDKFEALWLMASPPPSP
ncbi:MAG: hypothetical protein ABL878_09135 [Burkholderiales bacterium]